MPTHTGGLSPDVLNAALAGLEAQKQAIDGHIEQVRSLLGIRADGQKRRGRPPKSEATVPTESAAPSPPGRKRRRFSAATRARMAEAQRKRYAALRTVSAGQSGGAPKPKKRVMSPEARARIAAGAR